MRSEIAESSRLEREGARIIISKQWEAATIEIDLTPSFSVNECDYIDIK